LLVLGQLLVSGSEDEDVVPAAGVVCLQSVLVFALRQYLTQTWFAGLFEGAEPVGCTLWKARS
jgi:hypothetical protein